VRWRAILLSKPSVVLPRPSPQLGRGYFLNNWLLIVVSLLYAAAAIEQIAKGNYWLAVVLTGYVIANVGLWKLAP
jgi:hypothetical protein